MAGIALFGVLSGCTEPDPNQLPSLTPTQLARSGTISAGSAEWEQVDQNAWSGSEDSQATVGRIYELRGGDDPVSAFVAFSSRARTEGVVWHALSCNATTISLSGTELIGGDPAYPSADLYLDDQRLEVQVRSSDQGSSGIVRYPGWSAHGCPVDVEARLRTGTE